VSKPKIEWEEEGLQAVSSTGTTVCIGAAKNGEGYRVHLETPVEGEEPYVTSFAISKEALGIVLESIILLTGLDVPGLGRVVSDKRDEVMA
jgi:hypothetical protein